MVAKFLDQNNREFKQGRRQRQRERQKKNNRFMLAKQHINLRVPHVLAHFLPVVERHETS